MQCAAVAEHVGEAPGLVSEYSGLAVTAFATLRAKGAHMRAPVVAVLKLDDLANAEPPVNVLKHFVDEGCKQDLHAALKDVNEEQRAILVCIGPSDAPVQRISALAGSGKPTLLQRLSSLHKARRATWNGREAREECMTVALQSRTLRPECLQDLFKHKALMLASADAAAGSRTS